MASNQQFNLRWNNHTNNILQVFLEQLSSETLVDVTLSCQGQFIRAHKMVLSACSPYFQELFQVHQVQHPVIIMYGMKYNDVKQIVEFMYRGEAKVLEPELDGLLAAAEMLQVKGLSHVRNKYQKGDILGVDTPAFPANSEPPPLEPCLPSTVPQTPAPAPTNNVPTKPVSPAQSLVSMPALTPTSTSAPTGPVQPTTRVVIPPTSSAKRKKSQETVPKISRTLKDDKLINTRTPERGELTPDCGHEKMLPWPVHLKTRSSSCEIAAKKPNCRTSSQDSKQSLLSSSVQSANRMEDDELPATIKVEPLDIRDIDEELPWEPPRLVIDMRDEVSKKASSVKALNPVRTSLLKVRPASDLVPAAGEDPLKENEPKKEPVDAMETKEWRGDKRVTRIPRPPNAFMIFANEWRRKLALENPTVPASSKPLLRPNSPPVSANGKKSPALPSQNPPPKYDSNKDISVRLGVKWKNLSAEKKAIYYSASRVADEEHKRKYPNYYYSPKEARLRKSQQQSLRRRFALERVNTAAAAEAGKSLSPDPLRFVKVFMKDPSTRGMFVAVEGGNAGNAGGNAAASLSDTSADAQADLEEEFLKMVEAGHVEAEVEDALPGELDGLTEPVEEEEVIGQEENEMDVHEDYAEDTKPDLAQLEAENAINDVELDSNCASREEPTTREKGDKKSEAGPE